MANLTKRQLRKQLAQLCGDWTPFVTSAAGESDGSTLVASQFNDIDADFYRSWYALLNQAGGVAAQFTAANSESLSIADNAALSMGDVALEMVGWVRFDSLPTAGNQMALAGKWEAGNLEYVVLVDNTGGTIRFQFLVRNTANDTTTTVTASVFGTPAITTWYFWDVYHDPTANEIGIAINGGTFNTASTSGGVRDGTSAFRLGSHSAGSFLNGRMAGVYTFKHATTLLTSVQRGLLYNNGNGLNYTDADDASITTNMVAAYELNETSGTRSDLKSTNHLTDNNTVTSAAGVFPNTASTAGIGRYSNVSAVSTTNPKTFTVTPVFTSGQVAALTTGELHAYRPDLYTDALNHAFIQTYPYAHRPRMDSSLTVLANTVSYTIPTAIREPHRMVKKVMIAGDGDWASVPFRELQDWSISPEGTTLWLGRNNTSRYMVPTTGKTIYLFYEDYLTTLSTDTAFGLAVFGQITSDDVETVELIENTQPWELCLLYARARMFHLLSALPSTQNRQELVALAQAYDQESLAKREMLAMERVESQGF